MRRARWAALAFVAALAACGEGTGGAAGEDAPRLTVSAASSLKRAFTAYGDGYAAARVRLAFGGSDELAAQIRQGVKPDVFAAANTKLPDQLHAAGLVERPVVFAGNRLVLAVPAGSTRVRTLGDLATAGVRIAAGAPDVPVGAYTREVLARLPAEQRRGIEANIRSSEPDVGGVVGKLTQGAVDAGFVYVTDVAAAGDRLRAISLTERISPRVAYAAAVVKGAREPEAARAFVAGLPRGEGAAALRAAGFEPPPS